MPGGKGKSIGGKGGSKDSAGKAQKSHSAKAGLQVSVLFPLWQTGSCITTLAWKGYAIGADGGEEGRGGGSGP
jgi:hypothetical protein